MGVFKRYTEEARRAIYFARVEAVLRKAPAITPAHLLLGLSWDERSMVNDVAALKDRLPDLCMSMGTPYRPCTAAQLGNHHPEIPLDQDSKIAVAYTSEEADWEWCEKIDTDHLLRGILRFSNVASEALKSIGVTLEGIRSAAHANRRQRSADRLSARYVLVRLWNFFKPPLLAMSLIASAGLLVYFVLWLVNR
jgi:ATP-dependent Clp protease ATP-binding subunit ClpA